MIDAGAPIFQARSRHKKIHISLLEVPAICIEGVAQGFCNSNFLIEITRRGRARLQELLWSNAGLQGNRIRGVLIRSMVLPMVRLFVEGRGGDSIL